MKFEEIVNSQRQYFESQATKSIDFRISQLKLLRTLIQTNEQLLYDAIYKDFQKSDYETFVTEFSLIYNEIASAIKHVKKWSRKKRVSTILANWPSRGYVIPEPYGVSLIIGAWNYPYQLSIAPAIAAIAAGCTVILKPSELAANAAAAMAELINTNFDPSFFKVIEGGVPETTELLRSKFDKIFFTGSVPVGRIIYQAAAKQLTPVTLELGGKSPAIVMEDIDLKMAAKRLVWAKFLNSGQTCIAPDYILLHKNIKDAFLPILKSEIEKANYSVENKNYTQIINQRNFERLQDLIDDKKIYFGGACDPEKRTIDPTILTNISLNDTIMDDEIFGPILPILTVDSIDNAIQIVKKLPKPLSCYIFTKNKQIKNSVLNEISFGGGAVNDAVMHIVEEKLPFGGVGNSGIGNYHGIHGFQAFSHMKSVLQKSFFLELNLKYAPYTKSKLNWLKKLVK